MYVSRPARNDAAHIRNRRFFLGPAGEFDMADSIGHLRITLARVANGFSCVPCSLSRNEDGHVDNRNARRILVGLPNVMWPAPAKQCGKLLSQTLGRKVHLSARGLGHAARRAHAILIGAHLQNDPMSATASSGTISNHSVPAPILLLFSSKALCTSASKNPLPGNVATTST